MNLLPKRILILALSSGLVACASKSALESQAAQSAIEKRESSSANLPVQTAEAEPKPMQIDEGVVYRQRKIVGSEQFVAHILEIDLSKPGKHFSVTPADDSGGMEYVAMRTTSYLARSGAIAAVNASYFQPFAGGTPGGDDFYPQEGEPVNALGAVMSAQELVSPVETDRDIRINAIVCFKGLKINIEDGQICPDGFSNSVAAGPRLLASGRRRTFLKFDNQYSSTAHPRTAIGVSADRTRAWIIVVDGRQIGYSDGATLSALTTLFLDVGASDAINLDGGGSSTLVVANADGDPVILSKPIHTGIPGRERPVANHISLMPDTAPLRKSD